MEVGGTRLHPNLIDGQPLFNEYVGSGHADNQFS
jgi:hypothetical protein